MTSVYGGRRKKRGECVCFHGDDVVGFCCGIIHAAVWKEEERGAQQMQLLTTAAAQCRQHKNKNPNVNPENKNPE